jgi:ABC-type transport system involved in cytochrome bd biosynthesis fused ATPase/permease subunit
VDEIKKENTVIIIAHRFTMVRDADYVLVFGNGVVLEQGTPKELIEKGGWFHKFANAAEGREDHPSNAAAEQETESETEEGGTEETEN